jgi:hypothetical protein
MGAARIAAKETTMEKWQEMEWLESCLNKAEKHERLFILLARDPAAPVAIDAWIEERIRLGKNSEGDAQVTEARECARLMAKRSGSRALDTRETEREKIEFLLRRLSLILSKSRETWRPLDERMATIEHEAEHCIFQSQFKEYSR